MASTSDSVALASRLVGRPLVGEREVDSEGPDRVVVVGDEVVVKWLVPPVPTPHAGVELLEYLERHGFRHMPALVGVETVHEMVVAIVTRHLPGGRDGGEALTADLEGWLRSEQSAEDVLGMVRRVAEITAWMHVCLRGLGRSSVGARAYHAQALRTLVEATRLTEGDTSVALRALVGQVESALEPLHVDHLLPAHRVHGDLRVQRFVRSGDVLLLSGFEGSPLTDPVERRLPQSPMKDLASLVQSVDDVGRTVAVVHSARAAEIEQLTERLVAATIEEYEKHLPVDHEILRASRVAHALHDLLVRVSERSAGSPVALESLRALLDTH